MTEKNIIHEKAYWDSFYDTWGLDVPSQFCVQVLTDIDRTSPVVEFGSGNGRDSHYMASQGCIITAMDLSSAAIEKCRDRAAEKKIKHAFFFQGDVANEADIVSALSHGREQAPPSAQPLVAYSRFLLHALDEDQARSFIAALGDRMIGGERLYLEFRSKEDAATPKVFGNHYRRYVDTVRLVDQLTDESNFDIDYTLTGRGMARYREEDPVVSRVIATHR